MKLARPFSDGMVLQRDMPIVIWGEAETDETIEVYLDEELLGEYLISEGHFQIELRSQPAKMDTTLRVGDVIIQNVDFGDVWIAAGQSNMEMEYRYTSDKKEEAASDMHLRMYTVGQYSFSGERDLNDKKFYSWDQWYTATDGNENHFSAVAYHFARILRERDKEVPVGIINVSWGGTSASAWMDPVWLKSDDALCPYINEYNQLKDLLNPEVYRKFKTMMRKGETDPATAFAFKNATLPRTYHPSELLKLIPGDNPFENIPKDIAGVTIDPEKITSWGPGGPNEPGALYRFMLTEILGISTKGVIYYQGESDNMHPDLYDKLFSRLITGWREEWKKRNVSQKMLPFYAVQLAPFGFWLNCTGHNFPMLRAMQELVACNVPDVYLASNSDNGNIFDIHPKYKIPVAERLARLAFKYTYGDAIAADAPKAANAVFDTDNCCLKIVFENAKNLELTSLDSSYNGFAVETIPEDLLPPILGGVNGLEVLADGKPVEDADVSVKEDSENHATLLIQSDALKNAETIQINFAQTAFYQINLYNEAGIPAMPFKLFLLLK